MEVKTDSRSERDQNKAYKEKLEKIIVLPWKKLGRNERKYLLLIL